MKSKKVATYGLLVALAFILSYVERLIPIPFLIPGMKLGLANLVVITALYSLGSVQAFTIAIIRIVLFGLTFSNPFTMMYSLSGGLLSCIIMIAMKKSKIFSMVGISIVGGISHNIGQIILAILIVENINVAYYLPFLMLTGIVTGAMIGVLGTMILRRIKNII